MKACVLYGIGDLRYEDVENPRPYPGQVLVRVDACGVCGSDIPRVFQKGTYRFPTIPGHEFSGTVLQCGEGVDARWVGKQVVVFPLIPCRKCVSCQAARYALCEDYGYLGSRSDGAFAEYVVAPEWNLTPVPPGVSQEAAALTEPAAVAVHALRRAGVDAGDAVMIFGTGPVGLMLGQWARAMGASRVALADIDSRRLAFAKEMGFEGVCNAAGTDCVSWARDFFGRAPDVVVEASGSPAAYEQSLLSARTLGRVVLMGNPAGEMKVSQEAYWAILRKELSVFGTWNSLYRSAPRDEWQLALDFMASGKLEATPLITHRVGLSELPGMLASIRDKTEFSSKVLMVNPPRNA
ncbi:MAG TPA: galactitol-1-phosphate 5-dehydrogenase [Candidatus Hydrogenedentes bacterium]|nr:galactitol-1-phosphate 5-dehydrogenase [Candidatus Hydrogenedentota bacterium]HQH54583.1 galactitol-1-phosphate 5-dehydrogenase [Candidatus Hydrogenedentota bacterium]HQM49104.1 galactitol-1-phosphate 5-dehydrogenase [Candidatus Hydrogenedentota bacterium]